MKKSLLNASLSMVKVVWLGLKGSGSTSVAWGSQREGECEERIYHWCRCLVSGRGDQVAPLYGEETREMASAKSAALTGADDSVGVEGIR
jgi:hypothetical protein